jgi:sulfoxide reductase heme-binding subunit YedZ
MQKLKFTPLQIAVHVGSWLPLVWLAWAYHNHRLTVNPIATATNLSGIYALVLLVLCLACTPLNNVFGWKEAVKARRALGLYAFMYATIHVYIVSGLDYQFNFNFLYADFRGKLYIWVGLAAYLILLALAVTAFQVAIRYLGKNWKRLHRLIYPASLLVILHFAWAKKGDLFRLRGDIIQPLFYGLVVVALLLLRIPPIARGTKRFRRDLSRRISWMIHRTGPTRGKHATTRAESDVPHSP